MVRWVTYALVDACLRGYSRVMETLTRWASTARAIWAALDRLAELRAPQPTGLCRWCCGPAGDQFLCSPECDAAEDSWIDGSGPPPPNVNYLSGGVPSHD